MCVFVEMGIQDHLTCLLRNLYAGQEASSNCMQLELNMEQWTGPIIGKEYINTVYRHLAYLTYKVHHAKCQAG